MGGKRKWTGASEKEIGRSRAWLHTSDARMYVHTSIAANRSSVEARISRIDGISTANWLHIPQEMRQNCNFSRPKRSYIREIINDLLNHAITSFYMALRLCDLFRPLNLYILSCNAIILQQ